MSRSAPWTSLASTSSVSSPTSIRASGWARRLWYQSGLVSAPAFEANTTYRFPSGRYITGLTRGWPLRAPVVCSSSNGAPSKYPPTLPWFARNSLMTCSLKLFGWLMDVLRRRDG